MLNKPLFCYEWRPIGDNITEEIVKTAMNEWSITGMTI